MNELNWKEFKWGTCLQCPKCKSNNNWEIKKWKGHIYFKCVDLKVDMTVCGYTMDVKAELKKKGGIWRK